MFPESEKIFYIKWVYWVYDLRRNQTDAKLGIFFQLCDIMIGQIFIQRTKEQHQPHHLGPTAKKERFWTLKSCTNNSYYFESDNNTMSVGSDFKNDDDPLYANVLEPSSSFNFPLKNYHDAKAWMQAFHRKLGHPVPLTSRELYNYWFRHWSEIDFADDMFEEDSWDEIREAYRPIDIQDAVKRGWLFMYESGGSEITDFDDIEDDAAVEIHFHGETMAQNVYLLDGNEEDREIVCDRWGCGDDLMGQNCPESPSKKELFLFWAYQCKRLVDYYNNREINVDPRRPVVRKAQEAGFVTDDSFLDIVKLLNYGFPMTDNDEVKTVHRRLEREYKRRENLYFSDSGDEMNDPIAARSLASRGSTPPPKRKRPSTPDAPRKVKPCILIDTKCV